ncbi:MAG: hypothetical protein WA152_02485 [Microgenomates group bacterium]
MESDLIHNIPATAETQPIVKQSSFLVTLLSVLLLLSCIIAGFFAWQTQQLVKELTNKQIETNPTTEPTPTSDSTENWRSYTNEKLGFSFKLAPIFIYPKNIVPSEGNVFSNKDGISSPLELSENDILLESTVYTNIDETSLKKVEIALSSSVGSTISQPFQPIGSIKKLKNLENGSSIFEESPINPNEASYYIAIWKNNTNIHVLKVFAINNVLTDNKISFEQMAKSYVFNDLPNQTACTMDAKICPDGSAVGRSGPKCEFAPCPTQKPITSPQP